MLGWGQSDYTGEIETRVSQDRITLFSFSLPLTNQSIKYPVGPWLEHPSLAYCRPPTHTYKHTQPSAHSYYTKLLNVYF